MRNKGIITILVGIGVLLISILFSSGSRPNSDLLYKIPELEIVLEGGEYVLGTDLIGHFEGRVAIPLKYPLSLSVLLILIGTGIVLLSKNKGTSD